MMETVATLLGASSLAVGVAVSLRGLGRRPTLTPSIPPGWLPVLSAEALTQHLGADSLIASIRAKAGLAPANFERDYEHTIRRFMAFVQLLPASESHHHAQPGGLLLHALETANLALHLRRAQVLPPGVAPEDIQRREHRWTFGVFLAALIHDVGKPLADLHIVLAKQREEVMWSPLAGTMAECGATRYRVTFEPPHGTTGAAGGTLAVRNYAAHQRMGIFLLQRLVPQATLAWLSEDAELLAQLTAFLAGEDKSNALARIVTQADRESVRLNLLEGPRTRFTTARAVPLIERLMEALRRMLAEGGCLPLNRPGAAGFVADGHVWFVSKRVADEVRSYLAAHESAAGIPGPEKNDRLFDIWQEYGALVPNPETGGAIWRVRVQAEGFDQVLTLLCFPMEKIYSAPEHYPANFAGRVIPLADAREGAEASPHQQSSRALAEERATTTAPARMENAPQDGDKLSPVNVSTAGLPPMSSPGRDAEPEPIPGEEFLEEDDATHFLPKPPDGHRIAPMRLPDKPIKPDRSAMLKTAPQGPSEAAQRFMGWLQQGLANGGIAHNETGAMVHFAAEGMLLISPRIFRHFAERFGEKGDGTPSSLTGDKLGTGIQREVIKAGWHLLGPRKTNVHKYQVVRRNGKGGSQLSVMIIREPQRYIEPVPPANPHLVRSDSELEAKRELD